jgi:NAD(P)-dependent dehydrogenase (short-subunit alcohol dehydrogenase family)
VLRVNLDGVFNLSRHAVEGMATRGFGRIVNISSVNGQTGQFGLRLDAHGRFYSQTGALFWSDDYTGGEPITGPRGQYFSGDREVSPLKSLLGGGRIVASSHGAPGERVAGLFLDFEAAGGLDVVKTMLDDFTWAGRDPDDTLAFMLAVSATASF